MRDLLIEMAVLVITAFIGSVGVAWLGYTPLSVGIYGGLMWGVSGWVAHYQADEKIRRIHQNKG